MRHIKLIGFVLIMEKKDTHKNIPLEQITAQLSVSKAMIRFWEEEFDLPKRENGSMTPLELAQMRFIHSLIQDKGLTLADAKKEFQAQQSMITQLYKTIEKLEDIKRKLIDFKEKL